MSVDSSLIQKAQQQLDAHTRETLHFLARIPPGFGGPLEPKGASALGGEVPLDDFSDVGVEVLGGKLQGVSGDVGGLAHANQRGRDARRGACELNRALGICGQAGKGFANDFFASQDFKRLSLQAGVGMED